MFFDPPSPHYALSHVRPLHPPLHPGPVHRLMRLATAAPPLSCSRASTPPPRRPRPSSARAATAPLRGLMRGRRCWEWSRLEAQVAAYPPAEPGRGARPLARPAPFEVRARERRPHGSPEAGRSVALARAVVLGHRLPRAEVGGTTVRAQGRSEEHRRDACAAAQRQKLDGRAPISRGRDRTSLGRVWRPAPPWGR